jgi:hypothetical protein
VWQVFVVSESNHQLSNLQDWAEQRRHRFQSSLGTTLELKRSRCLLCSSEAIRQKTALGSITA